MSSSRRRTDRDENTAAMPYHAPPRFYDRRLIALLRFARRPFLRTRSWSKPELWLVHKTAEIQGRLLFGGDDAAE